jgi:hypothetical protein
MDDFKTLSPESSAADAGRWIGRVLIAVILGEGIWGLIVSLTNNLILPFMARTMGGDVQSPLYLGQGDINVPALFTSVLELCFAGIVAVILNSWVRRKPRPTRTKPVRVSPIPAQTAALPQSTPAIVPVQAPASVPLQATASVSAQSPSSGQFWSPPEPSRPAAAPQPLKANPSGSKPPKEVYYNIVGEPINPTENE